MAHAKELYLATSWQDLQEKAETGIKQVKKPSM